MLQESQEILEGRFKIIKKLGSGAFGEIFKGKFISHTTHPWHPLTSNCSWKEKDWRIFRCQNCTCNLYYTFSHSNM